METSLSGCRSIIKLDGKWGRGGGGSGGELLSCLTREVIVWVVEDSLMSSIVENTMGRCRAWRFA